MVRIGLIGCGDIAVTAHLPALSRNRNVSIAALSSRQTERLDELRKLYGVPFTTRDYKDLLDREDIDAVIVATPPWVTPEISVEALEKGKCVLCEKPVAMSIGEAEEMKAATERTGKALMVGMTYHHDPILHKMREWILQGRLGDPLIFRVSIFDERWEPEDNPEHYSRIFKTLGHGSPSVHEGSHIFDWLHVLNDSQVTRLTSYGFKSRPEFPESNYDVTLLDYANGDRARVEIAWFLPQFPDSCFEAVGPKGIVRLNSHNRTVSLQTSEAIETYVDSKGWWERCFDLQTERFVNLVQDGGSCKPDIDDAIYAMRITEALQTSMRTGLSVSVCENPSEVYR